MSTINLFLHSPASAILSERRLPSSIPLHQLKGHLERITGIPPADQVLRLYSTRTDDADARASLITVLDDEHKSLEEYDVRAGMAIKVRTLNHHLLSPIF
jgi:tubulin-specific chaperone B